jgi:hypothetical protein
MEFEHDLKKLRWAAPRPGLRTRILRDARTAAQTRVGPPWFTALERHWLYPGRVPVAAVVALWLLIASFCFTTPASLLPGSPFLSPLSEDDLVRIESERARLFAELCRNEADAPSLPPSDHLPPQS